MVIVVVVHWPLQSLPVLKYLREFVMSELAKLLFEVKYSLPYTLL